MLFSSQLPLSDLAFLSRVLRHNLSAGLSLLDVFRQQSERGPAAVRPVARGVAESLQAGESLISALEATQGAFPPLFLSLTRVGEETGRLPEVFKELEHYFYLEQKLRRQFISQSIMPVLQFLFAVLVIAGLIWVLGIISQGRPGTKPISVFGLSGTQGAITFLVIVLGTLTVLIVGYVLFKRQIRHLTAVESMLLRVPVLGPCLEAIAMSRLCLALQLTLDSGMVIMQAVRLGLEATGNNAFAVYADPAAAALKKKKTLTDALTLVKTLPYGFIDLVASAEEGGKVPEMMRHQAEYYQEEASRRMVGVTRLASGFLYLVYGGCMIYAIFSLAQIYFSGFDIK